jgi:hypothetical protein
MSMEIFSDLNTTHDHEERLRAESMALIQANPEFSKRLAIIQKAMTLIFGYTVDHKIALEQRSDDADAWHPIVQCRRVWCKARAVRMLTNGISTGA